LKQPANDFPLRCFPWSLCDESGRVMVNPSHAAPVNSTQTKINTFFQGQSASPRASPRPGALASRPVNSSPQKSCAESSSQVKADCCCSL
ncbi:unnamed protein product, partial [Ectocarpus sp. 12 AP-2014]